MKMPKTLTMPKIGVNMTEALIVEWLVKEGDAVKEGDHILDAETDKAIQEIRSTMSGVVARILVPVGVKALCQDPIALLLEPGEKADPAAAAAPGAKPAPRGQATAPAPGRVRISPLARKMAIGLGIDWRSLAPSRPGGRIVKADVLAASKGPRPASGDAAAASPGGTIPYAGIRRVIGERMADSAARPTVALSLHADAGRLVAWREELRAGGLEAGFGELLVMVVAKALREHPALNSTLSEDGIHLLPDINVGVAVDTDRGLCVPVIRNADTKGLAAIREEYRGKVEAARAGRASVEDLTGGSFTVTNLGMYGIEGFVPIINPPECCILGVGSITREPVVRDDGGIEAAHRMQLTLVFDHRIVDGAPAARFLQRVKHLVERPMLLLN